MTYGEEQVTYEMKTGKNERANKYKSNVGLFKKIHRIKECLNTISDKGLDKKQKNNSRD